MQINKEPVNRHSVQSYSEQQIKVNDRIFNKNIIICLEEINTDWRIDSVDQLNEAFLNPILKTEPEVIIIGHNQITQQPPISVLQQLSKLRIGIECMSIGSACRTFNVLLSENRRVTLGIIF